MSEVVVVSGSKGPEEGPVDGPDDGDDESVVDEVVSSSDPPHPDKITATAEMATTTTRAMKVEKQQNTTSI